MSSTRNFSMTLVGPTERLPTSLFDTEIAHVAGPALYAEPEFTFLNRSARPIFARVRATLDDWFLRYPDDGRTDLRARFRSPVDVQHRSAFFELFLHELLTRLDCAVSLHPTLPGISTHPDFLVTPRTGEPFYLEAIVAAGESDEEAGARVRMEQVYDTLNRMESPNFFVGMEIVGAPASPPPGARFRKRLVKELGDLDPDQIPSEVEQRPHWTEEHDGWSVTFYPIPKSPEARGKPGVRPGGIRMEDITGEEPHVGVRTAVEVKAKRYGTVLAHPYVIAVNVLHQLIEHDDVIDALLGTVEFVSTETTAGYTARFVRQPDGAWRGLGGPRNKLVSAVLVAQGLRPERVAAAPIRLYHNPWAERVAREPWDRFPSARRDGDRYAARDGGTLGDFLGLNDDWPGDET